MSKLPRFLLANDRDNTRRFVIYLRTPIVVAEVIPNESSFTLELTNYDPASGTGNIKRLDGLLKRMHDWYRSTL